MDGERPSTSTSEDVESLAKARALHARWKRRRKHIFVLTNAGKPIYTRWGDVPELSGLIATQMGLLQAVLSRSQCLAGGGGELRACYTKGTTFVFLVRGPLYLVAISKTGESAAYLRLQLTHLYNQIIFLLTSKVLRMLESSPSYDVSMLLEGTHRVLSGTIHLANHSPHIALDCFNYLPLGREARTAVERALLLAQAKDLLFGVLTAGGSVVSYVQPKAARLALSASDMQLILNFVSKARVLQTFENSVQMCLPTVSDTGFLHAHVSFVTKGVCLLLISNWSIDQFSQLSQLRGAVATELDESGALAQVVDAFEHAPIAISDLQLPRLWHFVFKVKVGESSQCFSPSFHPMCANAKQQKRLWRKYVALNERLQLVRKRPAGAAADAKSKRRSILPGRGARWEKAQLCDIADDGTVVCIAGTDRAGNYELYVLLRLVVPSTHCCAARACGVRSSFDLTSSPPPSSPRTPCSPATLRLSPSLLRRRRRRCATLSFSGCASTRPLSSPRRRRGERVN